MGDLLAVDSSLDQFLSQKEQNGDINRNSQKKQIRDINITQVINYFPSSLFWEKKSLRTVQHEDIEFHSVRFHISWKSVAIDFY